MQKHIVIICSVCILGLLGCEWLEEEDILMEVRFVPDVFDACHERAQLEYKLLSEAYVSITIYDSAGKQVVQLVDNRWETEGRHSHEWYGKDSKGDCVSTGLYVAYVKTGSDEVKVTVRIFEES